MPNKRRKSIEQANSRVSQVDPTTQRKSFSRDSYVDSSRLGQNSNVRGSHASADSARYSEMLRKRKRSSRVKKVLIAVACVLVLAVGSAGAYVWYLNSKITSGVDQELLDALTATETSDPFYMLLMGVDKSEAREEDEEFAGGSFRCDTIILCRIDPRNKIASLVSLPRDLQITNMGGTTSNPAGYGTNKLNAAYAYGGPALVVETVSKIAGVPISHYVECDFDGFEAAVDAVGGVEIDVKVEIDDGHTGVYVPAGVQTLNGAQALSVCRSRHTYDDYLGADGDALRTAYQRQVLSALASKLLSSDVGTILNTVNTIVQYVTTDMDVTTILGYAGALQGMSSENIYTASMPKTSKYVDDLWYDFVYQDEWEEMMERMDQGLPPAAEAEVDPNTGITLSAGGESSSSSVDPSEATSPVHASASIAVRNGTEAGGIASSVVEKLKSFGYTNLDAGNANSTDYDSTLIIYNDLNYEQDAKIIAAQLGCGTAMQNDGNYLVSTDLLVVIGTDYSAE